VIVGTPMTARDRPEFQATVGLLLTTLPLRLDLRGVASFRQLLVRVRETVLDAFRHKDVPFERIVEVVRARRELGGSPLVQAVFVHHHEPIPLLDLPGIVAVRYPLVAPAAKFDLTMSVTEVDSTMAGNLVYNADLFDRRTAERLCEDFVAICRAAAEDPNRLPEILGVNRGRVAATPPDPAGPGSDLRGSRAVRPAGASSDVKAKAMASLWAEVLGLPSVGVRDDFFDLGGHSLLTLKLLSRIRERFGRELPASALVLRPTVEGLVDLLEAPEGAPLLDEPLVAIRPDGVRAPFFCVSGIGGAGGELERLSRHLDPHRPFYALRPILRDGWAQVDITIEAMAADCAARVKEFVPSGHPIALGGYSFGAVVAYEMAQQLRAGGDEVRPLVILDSVLPNTPGQGRRTPARIAFDTLLNLPPWLLYNVLLSSDRRLYHRLLTKVRAAARAFFQRTGRSEERSPRLDIQRTFGVREMPDWLERSIQAQYRAFRRYTPSPYPGRAILIRSRVPSLVGRRDPTLGWDRMASGGVEVHIVAGSHGTCFEEPLIGRLATVLSHCLDRAEADRYDTA
jgi:syringomycin synthetase protein SyrE